MYLAHTLKRTGSTTEDVTFVSQQPSIHEVVTLLSRYQKFTNDLSDIKSTYQLLSLTYMDRALQLSTLVELGAIELSRQSLYELKAQRRNLNVIPALRTNVTAKKVAYLLPSITSFTQLAYTPLPEEVKDLLKKELLDLFYVNNEMHWHLPSYGISEVGPCRLLITDDGLSLEGKTP